MDKEKLFAQIKGGLIVSCQALETEPPYTKGLVSREALSTSSITLVVRKI